MEKREKAARTGKNPTPNGKEARPRAANRRNYQLFM